MHAASHFARAGFAAPKPVPQAASSAASGDPAVALPQYFQVLSQALGPMHWWPGRTRFEVIVGAILTQNTAWTNVERAIANLRRERMLTPRAIEAIPAQRLAKLI